MSDVGGVVEDELPKHVYTRLLPIMVVDSSRSSWSANTFHTVLCHRFACMGLLYKVCQRVWRLQVDYMFSGGVLYCFDLEHGSCASRWSLDSSRSGGACILALA